MSYHPTHQPYMTRDNNNSEWYFKIISLRDSNEFRVKNIDSLNDIVNINYNIVLLLELPNVFMVNIYNFTIPADPSKCIFSRWSATRNKSKIKYVPEHLLRRNWNMF